MNAEHWHERREAPSWRVPKKHPKRPIRSIGFELHHQQNRKTNAIFNHSIPMSHQDSRQGRISKP